MIKRGQKNAKVYRIQRRLQSLGLMNESVINTGKGSFGPSTQRSIAAYFKSLVEAVESGEIEIEHWRSLFPFFNSLPRFNGNADWVHAREGHSGKPYWPHGNSGITLDPGVDLGYIEPNLFQEAFKHVLSQYEIDVCMKVIERRLRGSYALIELDSNPVLKSIRISREQAEDVFPVVASSYWRDISNRFPTLLSPECPSSVQTVMLSLAYNRGAYNKGLNEVGELIGLKDWTGVAKNLSEMQQNHKLSGIRKRRKLESSLIIKELSQ